MPPTVDQLPRGRHGLTRHEVEESQRNRMLLAIAEAMTEKGYAGCAVADVIRRAGVSRETFYQQFSSKLDCFMSAFDVAGEVLLARLDGAAEPAEGTPIERFDRAFGVYVDTLAAQPPLAHVFLVEVYAAGAEALARRAALQARIVDRMAELLGAHTDRDRFACEVLVAAVGAMVTGPLLANDPEALHHLHHRVVDLVTRALTTTQDGQP